MRIYSCNDNEEKCTNLTRFKIEKLRNFLMVNEMEVYTAQLLIGHVTHLIKGNFYVYRPSQQNAGFEKV